LLALLATYPPFYIILPYFTTTKQLEALWKTHLAICRGSTRWTGPWTGPHEFRPLGFLSPKPWAVFSRGVCWSRKDMLPSGKHTKSYWKSPFIVDFPIENCDFP
jgi:hypothetical protein